MFILFLLISSSIQIITKVETYIEKPLDIQEIQQQIVQDIKIAQDQFEISELLHLYGILNMYGFGKDDQINLKKANYFLKLAASYGSEESDYYISILNQNYLDENQLIKNKIAKNKKLKNLETFLKKYRISNLSGYFQSLYKNNTKSILNMGYSIFSRQDKNCSSSVIYYQEVGKEIKQQNEHLNILPNLRRHNLISKQIIDVQSNIDYLKNTIQDEDSDKMKALKYFYGLPVQNYFKASQLFLQIIDQGDADAYPYLGYMFLMGLGVKQDYNYAKIYFQWAIDNNLSSGYNGLGYMYYNGLGVPQSTLNAISNFYESAKLQDDAGTYNYGLLHLINHNDIGYPADEKIAMKFLTAASQNGHLLSLYATAMLHLDGTQTYQSCELALISLKQLAEYGTWKHLHEDAQNYIRLGQVNLAFLKYIELSSLGDKTGQINAALLQESYQILKLQDLQDYQEIEQDIVFKSLNEESPRQFLFKEFYQVIDQDDYELLDNIINNVTQSDIDQLNQQIILRQFGLTLLDNPPTLVTTKLGDLYYNKGFNQNITKALAFYRLTINRQQDDYNSGHAFYQLSKMYYNGDSVYQDKNISVDYLQKSLYISLRYNVSRDILFSIIDIQNNIENGQILQVINQMFDIIQNRISYINYSNVQVLILFLLLIVVLGIKQRRHNINNSLQ